MGRHSQPGDPLTDRQQAVLDFLRAYHREYRRPATIRAIQDHMGISNPNGAYMHIKALVSKGYVVKSSNPSVAGNSGHYLPVVPRGSCPECGQRIPVSATK